MVKEVTIQIEDMKCTGCEATIRKRLLTLKGVYDARANFKTGQILLNVSSGFQMSEAGKAIGELGYTPEKHSKSSTI